MLKRIDNDQKQLKRQTKDVSNSASVSKGLHMYDLQKRDKIYAYHSMKESGEEKKKTRLMQDLILIMASGS